MLGLGCVIESAAALKEVDMLDLNMPETAAEKLDAFLSDGSWSWQGLANALRARYRPEELADFAFFLGVVKPRRGSGFGWYLKQLFPLTYRTHYGKDGKEMFCVWRMWFGKCFDVEEYTIGEYDPK